MALTPEAVGDGRGHLALAGDPDGRVGRQGHPLANAVGEPDFANVGERDGRGGWRLRDDVLYPDVSAAVPHVLHLFRPELLIVNENFRLAGSELARSVLGWIGGAAPGSLQSLSVPSEVLAYQRSMD